MPVAHHPARVGTQTSSDAANNFLLFSLIDHGKREAERAILSKRLPGRSIMEMSSTGPRAQPAAPQTSVELILAELESNPQHFADRLKVRYLFVAKRVAHALDIHKTVALEMLAKAGGAASHHYLQQLIKEAFAPEVRPSIVEKLRPYHALLLGGSGQQAPNYDAILATVQFAAALAKEAGTTRSRLLDGVFAALWQANTWDELSARHIKETLEPLYRFVAPSSGAASGRFEWSDKCHFLSRELRRQEDLWSTRYTKDGIEAVYDEADRAIRRMAVEYPGFLEAGLVLAKITMAEGSPDRAVEIVGEYIERAEALIPADYAGCIEAAHPENLPYQWLLSTAAEAHFEAGATASAAEFEAKLKRVQGTVESPSPNLALLLLASGDTPNAMVELSSLNSVPDGHAAATRAFVYFGAGQFDAFRNQFVRALLTMPWLRMLVVDYDIRPEWDERCGSVPQRFGDLAESALYRVAGLRDACLKLLQDTQVQETERRLEELWAADAAAWHRALMAEVEAIAPWDPSRGRVEGIGTRLARVRARGLVVKQTFNQHDPGPGLRR